MTPARFIGVDGGKSGVRVCAVGESGAILWQGEGPGFSYGTGATGDADAIVEGILDAVQAAGVAPAQGGRVALCAALTGLPGAAAEKVSLQETLASVFAGDVFLVDDAVAAHAGALAGRPGTVVSAGTGTVVLSVTSDGSWARRDGWGPVVGDRGSAYEVGVHGLRAAAAAHDGTGPQTSLEDSIFTALGGADLAALQRLYRATDHVALVAGLAPIVAAQAESGDIVARAICEQAGVDLAATAVAAARAVGLVDGPVSSAGRFLTGAPTVASSFREAAQAAGLCWREPAGDALTGAVHLARFSVAGIHARLVARQGSAT